jgi:hypothetical protein
MLQYQVREIIERIAGHAADLGKWPTVAAAGSAAGSAAAGTTAGTAGKARTRSGPDQASPRPLPTRRPSTR